MAIRNNKQKIAVQRAPVLVIWGLLLVSGWLIASRRLLINQNPVVSESPRPNPLTPQVQLFIGKTPLRVEVRKTEAEKALGLSYRTALGPDEGMAFIYSQPQPVMFWMKGMNFPLDFIWIARGIVVEITDNVPAPTAEYPVPRTVVPAQDVDMVVEVNAGFVRTHNISVGDAVVWSK